MAGSNSPSPALTSMQSSPMPTGLVSVKAKSERPSLLKSPDAMAETAQPGSANGPSMTVLLNVPSPFPRWIPSSATRSVLPSPSKSPTASCDGPLNRLGRVWNGGTEGVRSAVNS